MIQVTFVRCSDKGIHVFIYHMWWIYMVGMLLIISSPVQAIGDVGG